MNLHVKYTPQQNEIFFEQPEPIRVKAEVLDDQLPF